MNLLTSVGFKGTLWNVSHSDTNGRVAQDSGDAFLRTLPKDDPYQSSQSLSFRSERSHNIMSVETRSERHSDRESHLRTRLQSLPSRRVVARPARVSVRLDSWDARSRDNDGSSIGSVFHHSVECSLQYSVRKRNGRREGELTRAIPIVLIAFPTLPTLASPSPHPILFSTLSACPRAFHIPTCPTNFSCPSTIPAISLLSILGLNPISLHSSSTHPQRRNKLTKHPTNPFPKSSP
jgi:hypothetical protein